MEVLIATAILAIVMTLVYGSFVQTRRVIGRTEAAVDGLRGIRAVFSRITNDVGMAFLSTAIQHHDNLPPAMRQAKTDFENEMANRCGKKRHGSIMIFITIS